MFADKDGSQGEGDHKSTSGFGYIQIQKNLSEFTDRFGRTDMYLRSGMFESYHYPDRLFVSLDPIGAVHYDTIFLLRNMFGNAMSPRTPYDFCSKGEDRKRILPFGVVPSIEVQTGQQEGYSTEDALGRPMGRRPPVDDELDIISRVCVYCLEFAKERKLLGKMIGPSKGIFERTYPSGFSRSGKNDSVKVTYNLDDKFGGIWNAGEKWMWFDES